MGSKVFWAYFIDSRVYTKPLITYVHDVFTQCKGWINSKHSEPISNLTRKDVPERHKVINKKI